MKSLNNVHQLMKLLPDELQPRVRRKKVLEAVLEEYYGKDRHYHNCDHIARMLIELNRPNTRAALKGFVSIIDFIAIAILFHDIVYDVSAESLANEFRSASVAECMVPFCFDYEGAELNHGVQAISSLIKATTHQTTDQTWGAFQVICDLDLCGFADPFEQFKATSENVIKEYTTIYTREQVVEGRIKFLKTMQGRKVFYTDLYSEDQAQCNIAREIERLTTEIDSNM